MAMTLKQAFTLWANAPRNIVLATRSRDAVQKVLMKKWSDIDLEQITPTLAKRIFDESPEVQERKTKAASILVYVLQWGGDHGYCQRPTFNYTIANADAQPSDTVGTVPAVSSEASAERITEGLSPSVSPAPESGQSSDDTDPLAGIDFDDPKEVADALMEQSARIMNDKPKNPTNMEEKKQRGRAPMPVAQLHPETLEVIKIWPSRSEAEREIGACNLDRAIARKRMSAGFYWCEPDDAKDFKPNPMSKFAPKSKMQPKPKRGKEAVETLRKALTEHTVSPSEGGANHREQSPCAPSAAEKALVIFTDDELLEELDRRGWEGELSRRQVVTIGVKQ